MPKLTMKGCGCEPIGSEVPTNQCIVWGRATGTHSEPFDKKIDPDNLWTCLTGDFCVERDENLFRSARLFLPKGIQDVIEDALKRVGALDGTNKAGITVSFAFQMQTVKSSSPAGYQWRAVNLMPPTEEQDPIRKLRAELEETIERLALPAGSPRMIEASGEEEASSDKPKPVAARKR